MSIEDSRQQVREFLAGHTLGADEQTKITLFLMSLKNANALILSKVEFQPMEWLPYFSLHSQLYKEMDLFSLLYRATDWSTNPMLYTTSTQLNFELWQKARVGDFLPGFFGMDRRFYEYLALSHSFMADVRIIPLLPPDVPLTSKYLTALHTIETENGRLIQSQIRLLKDMEVPLEVAEKEQIIADQRELVVGVFDRFLQFLVKS